MNAELKKLEQLSKDMAACIEALTKANDAAEKPAAPARQVVKIGHDARLFKDSAGNNVISFTGNGGMYYIDNGETEQSYWDIEFLTRNLKELTPEAASALVPFDFIREEARPEVRVPWNATMFIQDGGSVWCSDVGGQPVWIRKGGAIVTSATKDASCYPSISDVAASAHLGVRIVREAPPLRTPQVGDLLRVNCWTLNDCAISGECQVIATSDTYWKSRTPMAAQISSGDWIALADAQNVIRPARWKPKAGDEVFTSAKSDIFGEVPSNDKSYRLVTLGEEHARLLDGDYFIVPTSTLRPVEVSK